MGQGVWMLTLVLGVAGFLSFANEVGSEVECSSPLKLGTLLIKTSFLPHKLLCYACTQWQVAGPQAAQLHNDQQ